MTQVYRKRDAVQLVTGADNFWLLPLTQGQYALVDECDTDLALPVWCATGTRSGWYAAAAAYAVASRRLHREYGRTK